MPWPPRLVGESGAARAADAWSGRAINGFAGEGQRLPDGGLEDGRESLTGVRAGEPADGRPRGPEDITDEILEFLFARDLKQLGGEVGLVTHVERNSGEPAPESVSIRLSPLSLFPFGLGPIDVVHRYLREMAFH